MPLPARQVLLGHVAAHRLDSVSHATCRTPPFCSGLAVRLERSATRTDKSGLIPFWFSFDRTVTRSAYFRHGLALMALKYSVDALLIGLATQTLWTPLDYLQSIPLLQSTRLNSAPAWLAPTLALWTLPFLWIGISMTIRRLFNVGGSAWWSLLFFIPGISYVMMAVLALAPSQESPSAPLLRAEPSGRRLPSSLAAMSVGTALGLALLSIGVLLIESYGLSVFMGTPFVIGLVTAHLLRQRYPATPRETRRVVVMTVLMVAGIGFMMGVEGAVCLLMAAPLGLVIAIMGGSIGHLLASRGEELARGALMIGLLWPGAAALEADRVASPPREVISSVVIAAPPEVVWQHVIAFSPIPEPTSLLFRAGVAYPVRANIVGSGVGAVRYCRFSTGAFVEPITAWEPGLRLSFDVVENPRPLNELSPWEIKPPHLDGYLQARAGEFRLVDLGGSTRLEGSTWYEQRLRPFGYWVVFSDYIISSIHARVLNHIKHESERPAHP